MEPRLDRSAKTPEPPAPVEPTAGEELNEMRKSLQGAGLALLRAATEVISAAANETLSATKTVIASAEDLLSDAQAKLRKMRSESKH